MAPEVIVDPGQVIRINARFPNTPAAVLFSYLPPQSDVAVHDPGADKRESKIKREGDGDLFHYNIDTRDMHGGLGWWYFVSEDPDPAKRRAKVGRFIVRDVPRALIDRDYKVPSFSSPEVNGFDLLGAVDFNAPEAPHALIGAVIGAAVVAVIVLL